MKTVHQLLEELTLFLAKIDDFSPEVVAAQVEKMEKDFKELPRAFSDALHFSELKFLMQKMRALGAAKLLRAPLTFETLRGLRALRLKLPENKLQSLSASMSIDLKSEFKQLLAIQGQAKILKKVFSAEDDLNKYLHHAGPQTIFKMVANRRSRVKAKDWLDKEEFSRYQFTDDGVIYRGMELYPGDMVLSSVNLDGNGVYTTLVEPKGYAYHYGIIAIVEHHQRRFPIVLETYEHGVRLVPLHQFFSAKFNCYFEIFRLLHPPAHYFAEINRLALEIPKKVKGYNFDTEDPDHSYLACTSVATYLFKELGLTPISTKSHYSSHPQVLKNLAEIELKTGPFLSPWDFIASPRTVCVGVWDNNFFLLNICRELCEREMDYIFKNRHFTLSPAPLLYYFNSFGVKQIQRDTILGKIIGKAVGFNKDNLPCASHKVLGMIEIYEHTMEKAVQRLYRQLRPSDFLHEYQSITQYQELKRDQINLACKNFGKLFKGKAI